MLEERFWMFCRRLVRSALLSIGFGAVCSLTFSIGKSPGWQLLYNSDSSAAMQFTAMARAVA